MKYIDMDTMKFLLYDTVDFDKIMDTERYGEHDKESTDLFMNSVKDFCDQELYPYFREMDEQPVVFEDGKIIAHPQIGVGMKKAGEMGLIGGVFEYEDGGLQLPFIVHTAATAIQDAANNHLPGYWGLTLGAAELVATFASQELKDLYLPKMLEGLWGGTMCLTEPQAGSSLSDVVTAAVPAEDGSYRIKGQKIFISGGDHAYCDNFVHLLLGRVEGAPKGTKGISLFIVPQKRIQEDGSLIANDVTTAGDFQKMGQRGYCTTHLIFGEQDDCRAWLVGEANYGLKYMFKMMNGARIGVGRGAASIAMAAYYHSLAYAKERPQGRKVSNTGKKDASQEQTLIINHPDVRRMLIFQKAVAEGGMSLVMQAAEYYDKYLTADNEEGKAKYLTLLELLTPMVKTFPSEKGREAVDNGLQVLGGYGFCSEYILQQYYRDIRIFALYEGTTGIQSIDLLGRKMTMADGKAPMMLAQEMMVTMQHAGKYEELQPYCQALGKQLESVQKVMGHLMKYAQKGEFESYLADATVFMEFFSTITIAWQWLKMAAIAKEAMVLGNGKYSEEFYESKIHAMRFFFKYEVQKTAGLINILLDENQLTLTPEKEVLA